MNSLRTTAIQGALLALASVGPRHRELTQEEAEEKAVKDEWAEKRRLKREAKREEILRKRRMRKG